MKNFLQSRPVTLLIPTIAVVIVVVIGIVLILSSINDDNNDIVARVGPEKITKEELYNTLVKYYGEETLNTLITNKIIELEAKKEKITVTDAEIQKEIDAIIDSYGGKEMFDQYMAYSGMTVEEMKKDIALYLKTIKLIEPRIKITDEEIESYFEENKESFAQAEQVEASHILVKDKATADEIKQKLDAGEDFAELAARYSIDTATSQSGGELGFFKRGTMDEAFEEAAFSMKIGETSEPVKTENGYHIIRVTNRKEAQEANLADSRDEIVEILKREKMNEEYSAWLAEKQGEYDIYNSLLE